jgi:hypothetical protein
MPGEAWRARDPAAARSVPVPIPQAARPRPSRQTSKRSARGLAMVARTPISRCGGSRTGEEPGVQTEGGEEQGEEGERAKDPRGEPRSAQGLGEASPHGEAAGVGRSGARLGSASRTAGTIAPDLRGPHHQVVRPVVGRRNDMVEVAARAVISR